MKADEPTLRKSFSDGHFVVTYDRRDSAVTGIDVFASWSPSLLKDSWKYDGDGMTEGSLGWTDDVETVSAAVPFVGEAKFLRINAVER
ncbi:hypothetical protein [Haloferula sp.]|uniref:hypothetical protein n=1 Tax=Haloferula sp. TaxID=2497595 RepID=UPI00329C29AC